MLDSVRRTVGMGYWPSWWPPDGLHPRLPLQWWPEVSGWFGLCWNPGPGRYLHATGAGPSLGMPAALALRLGMSALDRVLGESRTLQMIGCVSGASHIAPYIGALCSCWCSFSSRWGQHLGWHFLRLWKLQLVSGLLSHQLVWYHKHLPVRSCWIPGLQSTLLQWSTKVL